MQNGTVLALDYGLKRVGVATGEILLKQAHPLTTLPNTPMLFEKILQLTVEWQPVRIILGEPFSLNGEKTEMTRNVHHFAQKLKEKCAIPLDFMDERYTSSSAESLLKEMKVHFARKKERVDALSAQIILQSWFDSYAFTES